MPARMITVDADSFLVVVSVAAVAALLAGMIQPYLALPVVVIELLLGIVVGPEVFDLAAPDEFISFFANLGLGMLFFFAGYEIEFDRIKGVPLKLAVAGWLFSLVLAYSIGGLLAWAGVILSLLYVGSAMATTAIGTLIPILHDAGEIKTRFGTFLLAAGAMGEFGPILLITLAFSTKGALFSTLLLLAFVALAIAVALLAIRGAGWGWPLLERSLETSGQFAIRMAVVMVFALAAVANELGLDLLLGGFVAGIIVRQALKGREVAMFESKLIAVGYGFFIPFFFVTSGLRFDLSAFSDSSTLLKLPLFVALFLVIRGLPALILYRQTLDGRDRIALAIFSSTQLPLVVAITTIAVEQGHMLSSTAAALVGAAIISTATFPLIGLKLREGRAGVEPQPV